MTLHLVPCGQCDRLLNVTALRLGDEVRCVCDGIVRVGHPGHAGVVACPACSADCPREATACPSCGEAVLSTPLPPIPERGSCPRCEESLRARLLNGVGIVECSHCEGAWVPRETLVQLMTSAAAEAAASTDGPKDKSQIDQPPGPQGYVPCPACGDLMQRRAFRYMDRPSRVVLDLCRRHGIWFDQDELRHVLEFVQQFGGRLDPDAAQLGIKPQTVQPVIQSRDLRERTEDEKRSESPWHHLGELGEALIWIAIGLWE